MDVTQTHTLIVGASISGLACAACLQQHGIKHTIIEQHDKVATPWRNHYERLHLHTSKRLSNLPFKSFHKNIPRYPSRQQVVDYLDSYSKAFNIQPLFNTTAIAVKKEAGHWVTQTSNGIIQSSCVIMATGAFGKPLAFECNGLNTFTGRVLHSYAYQTGRDFSGQQVLVVGFGNSACEIAIDLYEQKAYPSMSVRSAVNVVPRDVLGIPVLALSLLMRRLPPRTADQLNAPLLKWLTGDITKLGLRSMPYGPLEQIQKDGHAPVLDIGTLQHIRDGHIHIYPAIDHIRGNTVYFTDGREAQFDAIVTAIGYYRDYAAIVSVDQYRFDDLRASVDKQQHFGEDGLYFCGYWISPTGQIREIASDARKIAAHIAAQTR
ncbi:flavin-containing monooxygenase [Deminuibacter soli]|uniref:NAD(P)/FAD-dependent oxidoreductase n=1 Tax=Deminuibacter soli TaxID=2291815 RepID=A0A3E1NK24_9BACT|nr:NAD(P)/FAD-dependent oxidoreductase [Deminuibacter soli]RFM28295.1 NAD(P)/FAD-dependent oxidoreductase [Deminuibacter soli]